VSWIVVRSASSPPFTDDGATMRRPLIGAVAGADARIGSEAPAAVPFFCELSLALVARSITRPVAIFETGATETEFFVAFVEIDKGTK
jgi:hypothetical protein